jgi:hypothetical protein
MMWLAGLPLIFFAAQATWDIAYGHSEDILWCCNIANVLLALGLAIRKPTINAIALCWLCLGLPLWLYHLISGGQSNPITPFTHIGGLVAALVGAKRFGMPKHVWWKALLALGPLLGLCRLVTPRRANVNLAFDVWKGWELHFPSYGVWLLALGVLSAGMFLAVQIGVRKVLRHLPDPALQQK